MTSYFNHSSPQAFAFWAVTMAIPGNTRADLVQYSGSMCRSVIASLALAISALACASCGPSATISVLRPAQLNARPYGGTMTVQNFAGHQRAAKAVVNDLRRRISSTESRFVRYVRNDAGLLIHGDITDYTYRERVERRSETCDHAVGVGRYRSPVSNLCYRYIRIGQAHVAIRFRVTETKNGRLLTELLLEDSFTETTEQENTRPPPIDGEILLEQLREDITARFAKVILPWRESVRVRFARCRHTRELCKAATKAAREGNYRRAKRLFRRSLKRHRQLEVAPRQIARLYWNLSLVHQFSAEFELAHRALDRAIRLDPRNDRYRRERSKLERLEREHSELQRQMKSER